MLIRSRKGQAIAVEYTMIFFIVVAVVSAMTVYVRRTVQGRMRDAGAYLQSEVQRVYDNSFYISYEPYYAESNALRNHRSAQARDHEAGAQAVTQFTFSQDHQMQVNVTAEQKSPRVLE